MFPERRGMWKLKWWKSSKISVEVMGYKNKSTGFALAMSKEWNSLEIPTTRLSDILNFRFIWSLRRCTACYVGFCFCDLPLAFPTLPQTGVSSESKSPEGFLAQSAENTMQVLSTWRVASHNVSDSHGREYCYLEMWLLLVWWIANTVWDKLAYSNLKVLK